MITRSVCTPHQLRKPKTIRSTSSRISPTVVTAAALKSAGLATLATGGDELELWTAAPEIYVHSHRQIAVSGPSAKKQQTWQTRIRTSRIRHVLAIHSTAHRE